MERRPRARDILVGDGLGAVLALISDETVIQLGNLAANTITAIAGMILAYLYGAKNGRGR